MDTPRSIPGDDMVVARAEQLLADLDLANIPEDKKQELVTGISALLDKEIIYAVMSRLDEKDVVDLETFLQESPEHQSQSEQAYEFLADRIPNLQSVIEDAVVAVYDRLKDTNDLLSV